MVLRSRYSEVWTLTEKDGGYLFNLPPYSRVGFNDDGSLAFIDPPGGPFLGIGDYLGEKTKITSFKDLGEDGVIIYVEEV